MTNKNDNEYLFDVFWAEYPKRPGSNKIQARRQFLARIKKGEDPENIISGARRYFIYCDSEDLPPEFIKMAQTFVGINQHYLCDWTCKKKHKKINFTSDLSELFFDSTKIS